jgi:uncharacterized protein YecE (DUF72 family)
MKLYAGTSGFSYAPWRGRFYPDDLPTESMLEYYALCLETVEINNTFYRMPRRDVLEGWSKRTPDAFRFALKAPRRLTHQKRLEPPGQPLAYFFELAGVLGEKCGPLLFQLPPYTHKDTGALAALLAAMPAGRSVAFEFRHPSWFADDVYALLAQHGAALCGGDADRAERSPPLVKTSDWAYLRLRAGEYDRAALDAWAARISEHSFERAFVFFKHEELGPFFASELAARFGGPPAFARPAAAARPALKKARAAGRRGKKAG